jgi:hypothetical protein
LALQRQIDPDQIAPLTGLQPGVVDAYVKLVKKYHPDLLVCSQLFPIGA